jgi:hypothetical protein
MRPLIDDAPTRGLIQTTVRDIAAALAQREHTTAFDVADLALLRSYLEPEIAFPGGESAGRLLAESMRRFNGSQGLGLSGGAARIGWTIAHLASAEIAGDMCARLDRLLAHALADGWIGEYDLCSGLVGFGVYALERGAAGHRLAMRVLDHLERTATGDGDGIAWHTAPELLLPAHLERAPDGYWNLGLAHGIPGVIALLSRFIAAGIEIPRSRALLDGAVRYLLAVPDPRGPDTGRYPPWQPTTRPASTRLAWCYGDLGVAAALLGAASRAKVPVWREGLALARTCAARTLAQAHIHDASICHGAAGIAHLFHRMARATGDEQLYTAARAWIVETLRMRTDVGIGGFPRVFEAAGELELDDDASLLTGAVGVALVLHAAISEVEPRWDRLLLVDLPPKP